MVTIALQRARIVGPGAPLSVPGPTMSDEAQHQEPLTIEELYRQYAPVVFRRALRFYAETEAEEVVHEVFLKVIENQDSFRGDSSPITWLYRVTTNHCLNRLRNSRRRQELLNEQAPLIRAFQHQPEAQEARVFQRQLWQHVDPALLEVGVYHYVDGLTLAESARCLECSPRTVVNRLGQLRDQIQSLLGVKK